MMKFVVWILLDDGIFFKMWFLGCCCWCFMMGGGGVGFFGIDLLVFGGVGGGVCGWKSFDLEVCVFSLY